MDNSAVVSHGATSQDHTEKLSLVSLCLSGLKKNLRTSKIPS